MIPHRSDTPLQTKPDLINALPLPANAPPFLHGLLTSLQQCQGANGPDHKSQQHTRAQPSTPSMDITQMMSAFRQLRPKLSTAEASNTEASSEGENRDDAADSAASGEVEMEECDRTSLSKIEALMDEKMRVLEQRMQSYVNAKVAEMMKQIVEQVTLQQMERVTPNEDNTYHTHNDNVD